MTLFVSVRLTSPVLETAASATPERVITVEQCTRTAGEHLDLTAWASGDAVEPVETGLDADDTVDRWLPLRMPDGRTLYRIRLTADASEQFDYAGWTDGRMVHLSSTRRTSDWLVHAVVDDRAVLKTFARECTAAGVAFDLVRATAVDQVGVWQYPLTDVQVQTLRAAYDHGFYAVPRETSLEELAASFDVSHQALSERLRRGVDALIETTIVESEDPASVPTGRTTASSQSDTDLVLDRPLALGR